MIEGKLLSRDAVSVLSHKQKIINEIELYHAQ